MTPADPLAVRLTDLIAKLPKHRLWKLAERFVSWREKSDGDEQFVSVADLERHVSSLAADLAGPRTCGWQPIETAPKDGRRVLVYSEQFRRRCWGTGYYFKGVPGDGEGWIAHMFYTEPEDDARGTMEPTHWQPMPTEPAAHGEGATHD